MKKYWEGKKVLITGGLGFLGSFFVEELLEHKAVVTVTSFSGKKNPYVKVLKGDLKDPKFASRAVRGQDIVFHLAALKINSKFYSEFPLKVLKDNIRLDASVAEAIASAKPSKTVYVSSVLAGQQNTLPRGSYGMAKRIGEELFEALSMEHGIDVGIVRLPNTFGPRDNFDPVSGQVVPALVSKIYSADRRLELSGDKKQKMRFAYAPEIAKKVVSMAVRFRRIEHVEFIGQEITFGELAEQIVKAENKNIHVSFKTIKVRRSEMKDGFKKIKLERNILNKIKDTVEWYEKHEIRKS